MTATTDGTRVLVVEDDWHERQAIGAALAPLGDGLRLVASVAAALTAIGEREPDLIVLDLSLPDGSGEEILSAIRRTSNATVLVHSGIGDTDRKVALLDAGADDFVVKPVVPAELLARVAAHLRRHTPAAAGPARPIRQGDLVLDVAGRRATRLGREIALTDTEWELIAALARRAGRTVTHARLWKEVWDRSHGDPLGHLRVHVAHLRRKLEENPAAPTLIVTDPGAGYRIELT